MEIKQECINFIQMLEREYDVDIKTTADYVEIRKKWINEGCRVPTVTNVQPRRSKSVRRGARGKPTAWNSTLWDRKKNPITWEDEL